MLDAVNIDDEMVKSTKVRLKHSAYVRLLSTKIELQKSCHIRKGWMIKTTIFALSRYH